MLQSISGIPTLGRYRKMEHGGTETLRRENPALRKYRCFRGAIRFFSVSLCLSVGGFLALTPHLLGAGNTPDAPPAAVNTVRTAYANLPMSFEVNQGQTDARVRFLARGQGYTLFLTEQEAVLALARGATSGLHSELPGPIGNAQPTISVLRLRFVGTDPGVAIAGAEELEAKSNYFIGQDPHNWHTDIPMYSQVRYHGLYPGVDLVYYGHQGQLEYDLELAPGKDPRQARFRIEGAARARLNPSGDLVLEANGGEVVLRRPVAYQGTGADRRMVAVRYLQRGAKEWGFGVGAYRRDESLTIDPFLNYATYLGGNGGDVAYAIAVDSSNDAYVAGSTLSTNFPQVNQYQTGSGGNGDCFVSKLNSAGSKLIYSTYLGGSGQDNAYGLALDAGGDAYVTGQTASSDFPVFPPAKTSSTSPTPAFQTVYGGAGDAFVTVLLSTGNKLVYSTYLGGTGADSGDAIAVDSSGNAYVTGSTQSGNFPTQSPYQANRAAGATQNAFVTKVNPSGTALVYSTYLGGSETDSGQAIKVDSSGNAYVAGYTFSPNFPLLNPLPGQGSNKGKTTTSGFVSEVDPAGSALVFSTYLGGSEQDRAWGLALDSSANIYVAGDTQSSDFPVTSGVFQAIYKGDEDAFVAKLAPSGGSLLYSTYLGGSNVDSAKGIAVDSSGDAVVVGSTQSSDFPTFDAIQGVLGLTGGSSCAIPPCADAFVTLLNPSGSQATYSTFLGGNGSDFAQSVAFDTNKPPDVYLTGATASSNFPVTPGSYQGNLGGVAGNAFVAMIEEANDASVAVAPATVNFGNETVSVASAVQSVTVANLGTSPLQIASVVPPNTDFTQTNNCVGSVPGGGGTCTINIIFTPTTTGSVTDQITINDNAFGNPPAGVSQTVTVTGDGVNSLQSVMVSPTTITFPNTYVTGVSTAQTVTITNIGTGAINFTNPSSTTPISITTGSTDFVVTDTGANSCAADGFVLNPGSSCQVSVAFQPSTSGTRTGVLSFFDTATGSPQTVSLNGNGLAEFTLYAVNPTVYPILGATATTCPNPSSGQPTCLTIGATAVVPTFAGVITFACPSSLTCTFTPGTLLPGSQQTQLVVSGLTLNTPNPLNFTIAGTSGTQTATLNLTLDFQTFTLVPIGSPVQNITAGQSATFKFQATPENGFNQQVNFTCSGNGGTALPLGVACSFAPDTPTLSGSSPTTITLTVTTTQSAPTTSWIGKLWRGRKPPPRPMLLLGTLWLAAASLLLFLRRRWAKLGLSPARWILASRGLMVGTLLAFLLLLASCRGAISNSGATPCGIYTIEVTGTLAGNSAAFVATNVSMSVTSLNCPVTP